MEKVRNKQWKDRHAKRKHLHELRRRYRYDEKYCQPSAARYQPYGSEEYYQSEKAKRKLQRRLAKNAFEKLEAPRDFSIHMNPEEALAFFAEIEYRVASGQPVYFDMARIEVLSIDTIMYFLAILKKIKYSGVSYGIKGSWPSNKKTHDLLESAGFSKYVGAGRTGRDLSYKTEVVQIENGQRVEPEIVRRVCDFAMSKLHLERVQINELYNMLVELMSNTRQHAYRGTNGDARRNAYRKGKVYITDWYVFVRFMPEKEAVRFIFLDTGEGIPSTVKRKGFEPLTELVRFGPAHSAYIKSALEGEFRSRTGISYRGNGLPKIYSYYTGEQINDLTIISNHGYFAKNRCDDMEHELKGTLFYWELSNAN